MSSDDSKVYRSTTRILVHAYAQELLEQGNEVRQSTLRDLIFERHAKKVSPNLVQDELRKFWLSAGPAINARLHRPSIPEALCLQLDQLWQNALDSAFHTLRGERSDIDHALELEGNSRHAIELGKHKAAAILVERNREIIELNAACKCLGDQIEHLNAGVRHWQQKYDALLQDQIMTAQIQANETERIQLLHRTQIEFIQELHLAEVQRLQEQLLLIGVGASTAREEAAKHLERTENHLMMETVRVRDEERSKTERLHKELRQANAIIDQLKTLKNKAAEDIAELKGRLKSVGEVVSSLRDENSALRKQSADLQNALIGKLILLDGQKPDAPPV